MTELTEAQMVEIATEYQKKAEAATTWADFIDACMDGGEAISTPHAPGVRPIINILADAIQQYVGGEPTDGEKTVVVMHVGPLANALSNVILHRESQAANAPTTATVQ